MSLLYSHDPRAYKSHSSFTDLKDFNNQFEMWAADLKKIITKRQYNFILALKRYMVCEPGISTAKYNTVVLACEKKYNLKTSKRTAERIMPLLAKFGIVIMYDTKMRKTKIRGANIIVWQRYDAKKADAFIEFIKSEKENKPAPTIAQEKTQNGVTENLPKTSDSFDTPAPRAISNKPKIDGTLSVLNKANKINYYIRNSVIHSDFHPVNKDLNQTIHTYLLTVPVKKHNVVQPLKFISRLKDVIYRSNINNQADVNAIIEIVYANTYSLTQFDLYKPMTHSLLEKALRIVDACLNAHKKGLLNHIKSMRGFIDSRIKLELQAVTEMKVNELMGEISPAISQKVVALYSHALDKPKTPLYNWLDAKM